MPEILPEILDEAVLGDGGVRLRLRLPADMPLFVGHFPGHPILPGVLQIHWAIRLGESRLPVAGTFRGLVNIKFQKPILPDAPVELTLHWDAGRRQLLFAYTSPEGAYSSGKVEFSGA